MATRRNSSGAFQHESHGGIQSNDGEGHAQDMIPDASLRCEEHGVPPSDVVLENGAWPSLHQSVWVEKNKRRLTLVPGALDVPNQASTGYQPSTVGGVKQAREQAAVDIK